MDYDFSTIDGIPEEMLGVLAIIILFAIFVLLVVTVLTVIINWKMLTKMGNEGWKSLIPVYNIWSICEGIGLTPHWGWIVVVAPTVLEIIPGIGSIIGSALVVYFYVIYCISIAKAFGKNEGFGVLLFFFYPIVGFILLSNDYVGKNPCHDFVFDDVIKLDKKGETTTQTNNVSNDNNSSNETVSEANVVSDNNAVSSKFCSSCGKPIEGDAKFCTNCGNQVNS